MQGIFYLFVSLIALGYGYELYAKSAEKRALNRYHKIHSQQPIRTWATIKKNEIPEMKIPVRIIDSGKKELVHNLNIVRDTPFATYDMNYNELLATVTPEEAQSIQELKEFLK